MADLRAITSGFESKSMGSGGGGGMPICCEGCDEWVNVCLAGGRVPAGGWASESLAGARGGVIGDMGGGTGDVDRDRVGLSVEIVRAGMVRVS